ncbi:MAG: hypothetical protein KA015_02305 [Spirochaetes bacterium]|nr:hypothetical protein [Spirochaetota bacterium]
MNKKYIVAFFMLPFFLIQVSGSAENISPENELFNACVKLDYKAAKRLIDRGVRPDFEIDGFTPLEAVICLSYKDAIINKGENPALVRLLLENGADPNAGKKIPYSILNFAIISKWYESAEILIKHGAKANGVPGKKPPLQYALENILPSNHIIGIEDQDNKDVQLVELLLNYGADPNCKFLPDGNPPLIFLANYLSSAVSDKKTAILAKILLKYGANPEYKTAEGRMAIQIADNDRNTPLVTVLSAYLDAENSQKYHHEEMQYKPHSVSDFYPMGIAASYLGVSILCREYLYKKKHMSNPLSTVHAFATIGSLIGVFSFGLLLSLGPSGLGGAYYANSALILGAIISVPISCYVVSKGHLSRTFSDTGILYYSAPAIAMAIPLFTFEYRF